MPPLEGSGSDVRRHAGDQGGGGEHQRDAGEVAVHSQMKELEDADAQSRHAGRFDERGDGQFADGKGKAGHQSNAGRWK